MFSTGSSADGWGPQGGLTVYGSTLYGMTRYGFAGEAGTIFSLSADGTNYERLRTFDRPNGDGYQPRGTTLSLCGTTLYGMTEYGGTYGCGTIFSIGVDGDNYEVLHSFSGTQGDSRYPTGSLFVSGSKLYGTLTGVGAGYGAVFSYDTGTKEYCILHSFTGPTEDGRLAIWCWLAPPCTARPGSAEPTVWGASFPAASAAESRFCIRSRVGPATGAIPKAV